MNVMLVSCFTLLPKRKIIYYLNITKNVNQMYNNLFCYLATDDFFEVLGQFACVDRQIADVVNNSAVNLRNISYWKQQTGIHCGFNSFRIKLKYHCYRYGLLSPFSDESLRFSKRTSSRVPTTLLCRNTADYTICARSNATGAKSLRNERL